MDLFELEEKRKLLDLWAARQQANQPYNIMMQGVEQPQQTPVTEGNINWGPGIQAGAGLLDKLGRTVAPMAYPSEIERFINLPPEQRRVMAGKEALGLVMPLQIGPVYHGSPYRFEKFKNEAIGTGEGAQAFGYGHYFTSSKEVAEYYKRMGQQKISPYMSFRGGKSYPNIYAEEMDELNFITSVADKYSHGISPQPQEIDSLKKIIVDIAERTGKSSEFINKVKNQLKDATVKDFEYTHGTLYESILHKGKKPGEYEYLRWESEVPKDKLEKLNLESLLPKGWRYEDGKVWNNMNMAVTGPSGTYRDWTDLFQPKSGQDLYRGLSKILGGDKEASAFLKRAGIDGIKYPVGTLSEGPLKIGSYEIGSRSTMYNQAKEFASGKASFDSFVKSVDNTIEWAKKGQGKYGTGKILDDMIKIKTELNRGYKPDWSGYNYVVFDPEDIAIEAVK